MCSSLHKIKNNKLKENPTCFVCIMGFSPILELHHVIPLEYGGEDSYDNTVLLCPNCHRLFHYLISNRVTESDEYHSINCIIQNYSGSIDVEFKIIALIKKFMSGAKERVNNV